MSAEAIITAARTYLGTPWKHQARCKGVGVDCIGLLVGAYREAGYAIKDCTDYGRNPNPKRFLKHLSGQFWRASGSDEWDNRADPHAWQFAIPGDVLVFFFAGVALPQHVGICTGSAVIHTYQTAGAVAEHALSSEWKSKVHSVWRAR
jgi:cell wall-associated NlpC family hydrolase